MTHVAILGPSTLLGRELRDVLEKRKHLWDRITMLAGSEAEEGTVTEVAGAPALVGRAEAATLAEADLIFACGSLEHDLPLVRGRFQGDAGEATAILLSPDATAEHGEPVVAGVNPEAARRGGILLSPHPAAVVLAYLLAPLAGEGRGFSAEGASATVVQPVSMLGAQGLEDLLDQARDLLAMTGDRRPSVFDRQLAFSLFPTPEGATGLAELARRAAGVDLPLAVHSLQGSIFHGLSCSLFLRFRSDPGLEAVREALGGQRHLEVSPADGAPRDTPAPTDAAAREEILVGSVRPDPGYPGGYWIWAVMDNLTRGGALNAVEVAERLASA